MPVGAKLQRRSFFVKEPARFSCSISPVRVTHNSGYGDRATGHIPQKVRFRTDQGENMELKDSAQDIPNKSLAQLLPHARKESLKRILAHEETFRAKRPKISGSNESSLHAAKPSRDRQGAEPSCRLLMRTARECLRVRLRAKPHLPG